MGVLCLVTWGVAISHRHAPQDTEHIPKPKNISIKKKPEASQLHPTLPAVF
jgi:hypothetical protein